MTLPRLGSLYTALNEQYFVTDFIILIKLCCQQKAISMSIYMRRLNSNYSKYIIVVSACASTTLLLCHPNMVRAAVFEEMHNGAVVAMDGGVPERASPSGIADEGDLATVPEQHRAIAVAEPIEKPLAALPNEGSVLLNVSTISPAKVPLRTTRATAFSANGQPTFPSPSRQMPVGADKQQMRSLANKVGLSYGRTPGVVRAGLSRQQFATIFTTMIHHESNFNPNAVSPAGAIGLGQLMPSTAADLGVSDAFSARENLDGSARYLTAMLDRFGSPELALAAYNAGPAAVEKYGGIPPYRETQRYVAAIVGDIVAADRPAAGGLSIEFGSGIPVFENLSTLAATR
ncbi:transglycosylase SLT domain-containing protein [Rhizobium ruizarguesonis]